jgi:hypothetical protein
VAEAEVITVLAEQVCARAQLAQVDHGSKRRRDALAALDALRFFSEHPPNDPERLRVLGPMI